MDLLEAAQWLLEQYNNVIIEQQLELTPEDKAALEEATEAIEEEAE